MKIFGNEYPDQLRWKHGDVKYNKGRLKFFYLMIMCLLSSSVVAIGFTLSSLPILYPIFIGMQLVGTLWNLAYSRSNYLEKDNVREIGFYNGEFTSDSEYEKELYLFIMELGAKLGLKTLPKVAIEYTDEVNAFAIGATRNHGLIIITSGLLDMASKDSVKTVIAHEMGHIVNGDMVGQSVVQSFVYVSTLLIGFPIKMMIQPLVDNYIQSRTLSVVIEYVTYILIDYTLFSILNLFALAYSRRREFRADLFSAKVMGLDNFIKSFQEIDMVIDANTSHGMTAFGFIRVNKKIDLFSTHPNTRRRMDYVIKKMSKFEKQM